MSIRFLHKLYRCFLSAFLLLPAKLTTLISDLFLGLRQGELLGLQWSDVDLGAGVIRVSKQLQLLEGEYTFRIVKNDKAWTITPAQFIIDMLKEHYRKQCEARLKAGSAWNNGDFVFCNEVGEHLSRSTTYHNFKAIIAGIGLPETRFHDLRHPRVKHGLKNIFIFLQSAYSEWSTRFCLYCRPIAPAYTRFVYSHTLPQSLST